MPPRPLDKTFVLWYICSSSGNECGLLPIERSISQGEHMVVDDIAISSKRLTHILSHRGLSDLQESDVYAVLKREWWPYSQREEACTDDTLDRLAATALQEWSRKGRVKGRFLAFLTVRIRDYCTRFRPPQPRAPRYYVARELPLDWAQPD